MAQQLEHTALTGDFAWLPAPSSITTYTTTYNPGSWGFDTLFWFYAHLHA